VRVNLKSGSGKIVPRFRSNVPRLLKKFMKQVTGKIGHDGIVTWHDGTLMANNRNVFFSADLFQILSDTFTINIYLVSE